MGVNCFPEGNHVQPRIEVEGFDETVLERRRSIAGRVVAAFAERIPKLRLLIFLGEDDWVAFKKEGAENRGRFFPVHRKSMEQILPQQMYACLVGEDVAWGLANFSGRFQFDCAIHVHGSTCSDDVGLTMTLAHEMTHFQQYGFFRPIWAANHLVTQLERSTIATLGLTWSDIPTEREARIVAKRTAEEFWGEAATRAYIERKLKQPVNQRDAKDWAFVQSVDTCAEYDIVGETLRLYQRLEPYRQELTDRLFEVLDDPTFADLSLARLFRSELAEVAT